jgi:hypothetical protein
MNQLMAALVNRTMPLLALSWPPPMANSEFLCVRAPNLGPNKWVALTVGEFMTGNWVELLSISKPAATADRLGNYVIK